MSGLLEPVVIGPCTLYNADCLEVLPTLQWADAMVTDPPYGVSADKDNAHSSIRDNTRWPESEWDKQRPSDEVLRLLPKLAKIVAICGAATILRTAYRQVLAGWCGASLKPRLDLVLPTLNSAGHPRVSRRG